MKHSLLLFALFFNCFFLDAQTIKGKVVVLESQEAVEYATVSLLQFPDSSLVTGEVTDENGIFELSKVKKGVYLLKVQFLGYEDYCSESFQANQDIDLGAITLSVNATALDEIEVTGRAMTSLHKIDKQVFDAQQFQSATGGTALDVLKNLPSVSVDALGEVRLRGSSGLILMVNGKPVQGSMESFLAQIPANSIDDIEIITAPSAKYDPDGKAGIINIKTKQNVLDGFYLNANMLVGLPSIEDYENVNNTPRYGADMTLNYRVGKWDFSAGLDYRRYDISGQRDGYVNTYLNEVLTEFPSFGERSFDEENYSARLSATFSPNQQQSISTSFYIGNRNKERTADILYTNQQRTFIPQNEFLGTAAYWDAFQRTGNVVSDANPIAQITYFNENLRVRRGDFVLGSLDYRVDVTGNTTLNLSALYERTILGGPTDNRVQPFRGSLDTTQLQFNTNDNPLDGLRLQADVIKQINGIQWESGYQFRFLNHPGDFEYLDRNFETNEWEENPLFTNRIELQRSIHSVYSQISGTWQKLQYSLGLRLEYFDREVQLDRPDQTFTLNQFNPFPSLQLQYSITENLNAKLGYSRRIERTTTFKMTPFPEREHNETLEQGDAELLPEYIDLVEIGLVQNWEDNTAFITAYFRDIDNVINRTNTVFNDTILNRIYTNVGQATALGVEAGVTLYPTSWSRFYLGANVYDYQIEGTLFGRPVNNSNVIYSINSNATFNLNSTLDLQLGFNYLSERVTAQGRDSRFYNPNLSLLKSFLDDRIRLGFQWLNMDLGLLASNEQRITTSEVDFFTTTNYIYEVDILQLTFSYRFNQPAKAIKLLKSEFGAKEF